MRFIYSNPTLLVIGLLFLNLALVAPISASELETPSAAATRLIERLNDGERQAHRRAYFMMGYAAGKQARLDIGFDPQSVDALAKGFRAAVEGEEEPADAEELMESARSLYLQQIKRYEDRLAQVNQSLATVFFEQLDQREGIQISPTGLRFEILVKGRSEQIESRSQATLTYRVTTLDGQLIDQGEKVTVSPGQVIAGMAEALRLLGVGGRGVFYVPSALAYGDAGASDAGIEPGTSLILEIELLGLSGDSEGVAQ